MIAGTYLKIVSIPEGIILPDWMKRLPITSVRPELTAIKQNYKQ